jgi:hypothetical protein
MLLGWGEALLAPLLRRIRVALVGELSRSPASFVGRFGCKPPSRLSPPFLALQGGSTSLCREMSVRPKGVFGIFRMTVSPWPYPGGGIGEPSRKIRRHPSKRIRRVSSDVSDVETPRQLATRQLDAPKGTEECCGLGTFPRKTISNCSAAGRLRLLVAA